jgi:hypothetical protein
MSRATEGRRKKERPGSHCDKYTVYRNVVDNCDPTTEKCKYKSGERCGKVAPFENKVEDRKVNKTVSRSEWKWRRGSRLGKDSRGRKTVVQPRSTLLGLNECGKGCRDGGLIGGDTGEPERDRENNLQINRMRTVYPVNSSYLHYMHLRQLCN